MQTETFRDLSGKRGKGSPPWWVWVCVGGVARDDLAEKVTFEPRPEGGDDTVWTWGSTCQEEGPAGARALRQEWPCV